jgi:hypothetical protein
MTQFHDAYHHAEAVTLQNVSYNNSAGASVQSAAFQSQTYWIRVCVIGAYTATAGLRYSIGANPTASATTQLLPVNWVETIRVTPGQKIAFLGNDTVTGSVNIVELAG